MNADFDFDIVIRNGSIADGLGAPLLDGDVAIIGDRIVAVGEVQGRGREEIDATGKLVTPGFVDIHTHYDGQATWDDRLAPSCWHGVTTVVMGNCGVGFAPVRQRDRDTLIELMEGIEDIPGTALHEGLSWDWESFSEYLDLLGARTFDVDVCAQVPHGPLRVYVMGDRAARLEDANAADIAEMRRLATEAIHAGALGFSTSRSLNHKSIKGDPTPSLRAREEELTGIALGLKDAGSGVLQWISDFLPDERVVEYGMIERIVRESGRPMSISVGQTHNHPDTWQETMSMIAARRAEGMSIVAQVAPRPVGVIYGLTASGNPLARYAKFKEIAGKPLEDMVAAMRDPSFRKILTDQAKATEAPADYSRIFPMGTSPDYGQGSAPSVAQIAQDEGRHVADVVYDLLLEREGHSLLFYAAVNYFEYNFDAIRAMFSDPASVLGLSDGGAHVGLIADASFPTSAITIWGRPEAEAGLGIADVIRRQTSATARTVGLYDRGVLAPGMKADVNVIDLKALAVEAPYVAFDLPAGARRLLQGARGYEVTVKSGVMTYRNGEATGALPGRLVRGAQMAPT